MKGVLIMTQEELKKLGLTDEVAQKILADQGNKFVPIARFNEVNEAKKALEGQITDRDSQLKELKKAAGSSEELKAQIEKLQKANTDQKSAYDKQIQDMKIDSIVNSALSTAKAKNAKAVKAMLKLDKYELEGDKVKGLDEAIAAVKKDNAWAFEKDAGGDNTKNNHIKIDGFKPSEGADNKPSTPEDQVLKTFGDALSGNIG